MIHELIYKIGAAIRNKSLDEQYIFLKKSEKWSKKELLKYQLEKCKSFVEFVNEHSPYYRARFKEIGFVPQELKSVDDLKKIPSIDKSVIRQHTDDIHTNFPFKKKFLAKTSGTSGQSLIFYKDEEWDSHNRAAMYRGFSWYNVQPWERNGYFRGYNPDSKSTAVVDWLQNRKRIFSYKDEDVVEFIKGLDKISYLEGYSSMIYEIAKAVNRLGIKGDFNLKMIKGTSEKIYDSYQPEIIEAFGRKMISEYGAAEAGLIAFECPEGNMHINVENVVVEVEEGEIIVTNLVSRSFPIIRYKLGDSVTLAEDGFKCSCGREHPVILDVLGRIGKTIVGYKERYSPFTIYYLFKNLATKKNIFLNYQAIQHEPGKIELRVEQADNNYRDLLMLEIENYFRDDVQFEIKFGEDIQPKDGKLRDFISYIDD